MGLCKKCMDPGQRILNGINGHGTAKTGNGKLGQVMSVDGLMRQPQAGLANQPPPCSDGGPPASANAERYCSVSLSRGISGKGKTSMPSSIKAMASSGLARPRILR